MNTREILKGFFIAIAANVLAVIFYYLIAWFFAATGLFDGFPELWRIMQNAFVYLMLGIGFSQVLHIIPIALWLRRRGRIERMKGLLIGAALTALVCGGCFILAFPSIFNYLIVR